MTHILFALFCVFATGVAGAAPLVHGIVTAGAGGPPLQGTGVEAELRGNRKTALSTDATGRFEIDLGSLFDAGDLRHADALVLFFSMSGYDKATKVMPVEAGRFPQEVRVPLTQIGAAAALEDGEKRRLERYRGAPGSLPLYLIPYTLPPMGAAEPKDLNEQLRANLERVILTHVQASGVRTSGVLSVKLLPDESIRDVDRMRAYGDYLKALAVITGAGSIEGQAAEAQVVQVASTYVVVPQGQAQAAPVLYVDDEVPASHLASPRLYHHLSKLWGRSTVLALGLREFAEVQARNDRESLTRIRGYVQAERANAGPGNEVLVSQLNAFLELVDRELKR